MCAADDYDNEDDDDDYSGFERDMCVEPLPATVQLCEETNKNILAKTSQIALILLGNKALSKICLFSSEPPRKKSFFQGLHP